MQIDKYLAVLLLMSSFVLIPSSLCVAHIAIDETTEPAPENIPFEGPRYTGYPEIQASLATDKTVVILIRGLSLSEVDELQWNRLVISKECQKNGIIDIIESEEDKEFQIHLKIPINARLKQNDFGVIYGNNKLVVTLDSEKLLAEANEYEGQGFTNFSGNVLVCSQMLQGWCTKWVPADSAKVYLYAWREQRWEYKGAMTTDVVGDYKGYKKDFNTEKFLLCTYYKDYKSQCKVVSEPKCDNCPGIVKVNFRLKDSSQELSPVTVTLDMLNFPKGWKLHRYSGSFEFSPQGILTINTSSYFEFIAPKEEWVNHADSNYGWEIETRMRLVAPHNKRAAGIWITSKNGSTSSYSAINLQFLVFSDGIQLGEFFPMDTNTFHTYKIKGKGNNVSVYVDNSLTITRTIESGGGTPALMFGDLGGGQRIPTISEWDYFSYTYYK
jgi:hypothetical protein